MKYYYKAQKDFEKQTGKSPYRQVDSGPSFAEYFEKQPESFKRQWLGAKRYSYYAQGAISINELLSPDTSYYSSISSIQQQNHLAAHKLSIDDVAEKLFSIKTKIVNIFQEKVILIPKKDYNEADRKKEKEVIEKSKQNYRKIKYKECHNLNEAEEFVRNNLGINAEYRKAGSLEVVNKVNSSLLDFFIEYGDLDSIKEVKFRNIIGNEIAEYSPGRTI